jgi:hypothetical protein
MLVVLVVPVLYGSMERIMLAAVAVTHTARCRQVIPQVVLAVVVLAVTISKIDLLSAVLPILVEVVEVDMRVQLAGPGWS